MARELQSLDSRRKQYLPKFHHTICGRVVEVDVRRLRVQPGKCIICSKARMHWFSPNMCKPIHRASQGYAFQGCPLVVCFCLAHSRTSFNRNVLLWTETFCDSKSEGGRSGKDMGTQHPHAGFYKLKFVGLKFQAGVALRLRGHENCIWSHCCCLNSAAGHEWLLLENSTSGRGMSFFGYRMHFGTSCSIMPCFIVGCQRNEITKNLARG